MRTQADRILPTGELNFPQQFGMGIGVTPAATARARETAQKDKFLATHLNELRDSYYDRLAKVRLEALEAQQKGEGRAYQEKMAKFQEIVKEAVEHDKGKPPEDKLRLRMQNVMSRLRADLLAKQGKRDMKKVSPYNRTASQRLDDLQGD